MTQAPSVPVTVGGCEAVGREIAKYGDWNPDTMLAIARAENRTCDPLNHNETMSENHGSCVGSYGVLQVGCIHYRHGEDVNDFETNIKVAHRAWLERREFTGNGYTAWTMYNNGKYSEFLK